jgi:hypothetical protein
MYAPLGQNVLPNVDARGFSQLDPAFGMNTER